jgi:NAD(P)-dependent dehydrogenase (short-subunit alcohol dehydrogenase family)
VRQLAQDALGLGGGRVDVLVNNAGIYPFGPTEDMEESLFDAVHALNVKAPFYLYGSSKAALNLLTKAWAAEYGPRGVRVNAVQVGPTRTETTAQSEEDRRAPGRPGARRTAGVRRGDRGGDRVPGGRRDEQLRAGRGPARRRWSQRRLSERPSRPSLSRLARSGPRADVRPRLIRQPTVPTTGP